MNSQETRVKTQRSNDIMMRMAGDYESSAYMMLIGIAVQSVRGFAMKKRAQLLAQINQCFIRSDHESVARISSIVHTFDNGYSLVKGMSLDTAWSTYDEYQMMMRGYYAQAGVIARGPSASIVEVLELLDMSEYANDIGSAITSQVREYVHLKSQAHVATYRLSIAYHNV